jgi:LPS-assembly lipoprotein
MRGRGARARAGAAAAAAAVAVLVGGCGFHLQGVGRLPPVLDRTYVATADRYTDFHQSLAEALDVSGATIVTRGTDASAVVDVLHDETGQRVLSLSARNTPREYEVYYTVEYRVRAGDRELLPPQRLTLTREYNFDETQLLAKQQEQELIRAALARELAGLVMRRLAALPAEAVVPAPVPAAGSPAAAGH